MTTGLAEARAFKMSASRASIAEMIIPELRRKIQPEVCEVFSRLSVTIVLHRF